MQRKRTAAPAPAIDQADLLARAVHELRHPLATVTLATRLLRDPDPAVVEEACATIERQTARMAQLLRELADVAPRPAKRTVRRG